jgi:hypothetical protein
MCFAGLWQRLVLVLPSADPKQFFLARRRINMSSFTAPGAITQTLHVGDLVCAPKIRATASLHLGYVRAKRAVNVCASHTKEDTKIYRGPRGVIGATLRTLVVTWLRAEFLQYSMMFCIELLNLCPWEDISKFATPSSHGVNTSYGSIQQELESKEK